MNTGAVLCAFGLFLIMLSADDKNIIFLVASTVVFMVGNSLMVPTSSSLVTKQSSAGQGASLGLFASFASLGRIIGPVTGGALFGLSMNLPYITGSAFLVLIVLVAGGKIGMHVAQVRTS